MITECLPDYHLTRGAWLLDVASWHVCWYVVSLPVGEVSHDLPSACPVSHALFTLYLLFRCFSLTSPNHISLFLFDIHIILSNTPFLSLKVQYISYPFSLKGRERRGLHVSVYFVFHFLALDSWVRISCLAVSLALYFFACALFLVYGSESMLLSVCQSPLIWCFASCFAPF